MEFIEVKGNLFDTESYTYERIVLAHCIASDFGMCGGIATQFIERYNMKNKLLVWSEIKGIDVSEGTLYRTSFGKYKVFTRPSLVGKAARIGRVYNLVTKELTSGRPTMDTLKESLVDMREQMIYWGDKVLAIPDMIGCGIDGLDRREVINTIHDVFKNTDIKIYAVKLDSVL